MFSDTDKLEMKVGVPLVAFMAVGFLLWDMDGVFAVALCAIVLTMCYPAYMLACAKWPARFGKAEVLSGPAREGAVSVKVSRSRHLLYPWATVVRLDGEAVAKTYRGKAVTLWLPEGWHDMEFHQFQEDDVRKRIDVREGLELFLDDDIYAMSEQDRDSVMQRVEGQAEERYRRGVRAALRLSIALEAFHFTVAVAILWKVFDVF
ncbi:MAG: hypothetical protein LBS92_01010 [Candidatus Methanoplasma sp.]|nr:hypothetical protein [Candidatus Methanoplasma sp.]